VRRDPSALEPSVGKQPSVAFNLAILNALIGTPWLPDLTGHVLMIEEVSEPLYRIDRMLFQMAHATQLKGIAGVRLGRVNDVIPNDPPFAESVQQSIERWCREMGVPFLGAADIGHDAENRVVPFGTV
jgi:muramoyltetrapeptide carboxypeptidase